MTLLEMERPATRRHHSTGSWEVGIYPDPWTFSCHRGLVDSPALRILAPGPGKALVAVRTRVPGVGGRLPMRFGSCRVFKHEAVSPNWLKETSAGRP